MPAKPVSRELVDGRRQRGEVSRERIVRAMLERLAEGDIAPSAEAVAARAGVGLRTVFRHFDNMESLYQEINAKMAAEIEPMWRRPFIADDWRGRILEIIERRVAIFERIMPFRIAADVHAHRSPFLAAEAARMLREQRTALAAVLPADVDPLLLESLDLLLSFDTWRRLRKGQQLPSPGARTVLERLVGDVLAAG